MTPYSDDGIHGNKGDGSISYNDSNRGDGTVANPWVPHQAQAGGPDTITWGQTGVRPTAQHMDTLALDNGLELKADASNASGLFVGTGDVTIDNGYKLVAGDTVFWRVNNMQHVWLISESAEEVDKIYWLGS